MLVTFLKIALDELTTVWHAENAAVEVRLPQGFRMDSNDLAGKLYNKVTSFRVPDASLKLLLSKPASSYDWYETAEVMFDVNLDIYSAPPNWRQKAQAQAEFLAAQDSHTCRAFFLYMPDQSVPSDTLAPGKHLSVSSSVTILTHLLSGRGMLDTELYLPQLRIPTSQINRQSQSRIVNTALARTHQQPAANKHFMHRVLGRSDSEGEENISEADRDARLA